MAQQNDILVTPTITSGSAYASGNQIGGLLTITGVNTGGSDGCALQKIVVVDKSGQNAAMDVLLFSAAPAVGSDKAAVSISASDMVSKCIGNLKITTGTYSTVGTPGVATYSQPNLPLYCKPATAANGGTNGTLYAVLVSRGTPTYTSTSDLTVKLQFSWD